MLRGNISPQPHDLCRCHGSLLLLDGNVSGIQTTLLQSSVLLGPKVLMGPEVVVVLRSRKISSLVQRLHLDPEGLPGTCISPAKSLGE